MIIVKADMDALLRGETLEEPVVEDDEGVMPYVANAIMAACNMVVYAEVTYGPIAADLIVEGLKGDTVKNALNKAREEMQKCESEE